MTEHRFDYGRMIAEALRGVARQALAHVAEEGLPGEHHFYLTFRPRAEGVHVPPFLRDQYPDEMTVVLQNQFWDLLVDDDGFSVSLAFAGSRHRIMVPWPALTAFADPTAQIGLRFVPEAEGKTAADGADGEDPSPWGGGGRRSGGDAGDSRPATEEAGAGEAADGEGKDPGEPRDDAAADAVDNVVRLDRFRRRDADDPERS